MRNLNEQIGFEMRSQRLLKRTTLAQMADRLGLSSRNTVSTWERGKVQISVTDLGNRVRIWRSIKHYKNGFLPLKSDSSERTITLDDVTMEYLKPFIAKAKPFVFGETRSLPITSVQKVFEEGIKKSGVPRIRIHDLRHSHATMLINNGVNIVAVSRRLGHSDINITLKVYSHLLRKTEDEMVTTISNLHRKSREK